MTWTRKELVLGSLATALVAGALGLVLSMMQSSPAEAAGPIPEAAVVPSKARAPKAKRADRAKDAAAKKAPAEKRSAKPSAACEGPFTIRELELYGALRDRLERLEAAEAAVAVREILLDAREETLVARQEDLVRLEREIENRFGELQRDEQRILELLGDLAKEEHRLRDPEAAKARAAAMEKARAALAEKEAKRKAEEPKESASAGRPLPADHPMATRLQELRRMRSGQLAAIVKNMKPVAAAQLLASVPAGLSTEVLSILPARKSGKILSLMDPESASGLSVAFIHRLDPEAKAPAPDSPALPPAGEGSRDGAAGGGR